MVGVGGNWIWAESFKVMFQFLLTCNEPNRFPVFGPNFLEKYYLPGFWPKLMSKSMKREKDTIIEGLFDIASQPH